MSETTASGDDPSDATEAAGELPGAGRHAAPDTASAEGATASPVTERIAPADREPAPSDAVDGQETDADADPTGVEESDVDAPDADTHTANVGRWRALSAKRRDANGKRKPWPWFIEIPALIVVAFLLTFCIQTFVARVYYVPTGSMEKTIHGVQHGGDRILAYKLGYDFGSPHQGDIVVFEGPPSWTPEASIPGPSTWYGKAAQALGSVIGIAPPNEKDFVKRVIAVGGQTVSCCDVAGRVQVNGISLNEPYLYIGDHDPRFKWIRGISNCKVDPNDPARYESYRCFGPYTVPNGDVWVMGDHRSDSADSTYQCRGLVPAKNVHCQGPVPVDDIVGRAVAIVMPVSRWRGLGSPDIMSGDVAKSSK